MIKIALSLLLGALFVLLSAEILNHFAFLMLTNQLLWLGDTLLLSAFALLLCLSLKLFAQHIFAHLKAYFSATQRHKRAVLFAILQKENLQRLFKSQQQQVAYFATQQRQRLLTANNKQHCRRLAKNMLLELSQIRQQLSISEFKSYQHAIMQACKQQNSEALLALQREISTRFSCQS